MDNAPLTVEETAATLRCSRSRVFELLADGTLHRAPRYGRKTLVAAEGVFAACEAEYHPPAPQKRARRSTASVSRSFDDLLAKVRSA